MKKPRDPAHQQARQDYLHATVWLSLMIAAGFLVWAIAPAFR